MKIRYKILSLLVCMAVLLSFGGCTSFVGVEGLLSPPQLEGDQQEIYNALCRSVTGEPDLVYPIKGKYKSAITLLNIDDEESMEAIAFYATSQNTAGGITTMPIRVNILDLRDGNWVSVYDMGVDADEVEKLDVVRSKGQRYLAVGYNYAGTPEKQVKIYRYADNILSAINFVISLHFSVEANKYSTLICRMTRR